MYQMITEIGVSAVKRKLCYRKDEHYISGLNEPLWRYGHSKLSKMAAAANWD